MAIILDKLLSFLWPSKPPSLNPIVHLVPLSSKLSKGQSSRADLINLIKYIHHVISNVLLLPIGIILYIGKYRFIVGTKIQQIGEIPLLDFAIKENKLRNNSKIICFYNPKYHDNSYLLKLYSEHVTFIENKMIMIILMPISQIRLIQIDITVYDANSNNCKNGIIYSRYQNLNKAPLISIPMQDKELCKNIMSEKMGIQKPFVCIHARESGYKENIYNDLDRTTRNSDIKTYDLVIKKLIDSGVSVIRIGDKSMSKTEYYEDRYKGDYFDYAHSNLKSELMDTYLISECNFLIACSSGPSDVSSLFNVNTLLLNGYPVVNSLRYVDGDLSTFKKIVSVETNKALPLELLFQSPWDSSLQHRDLEKLGYKLLDNTRHELQAALQDFLDLQATGDTDKYSVDIRSFLKTHHFSYQAAGNISRSFIDTYSC